MRESCGSCAYRPGAAANREPDNHLRGLIASVGAVPFFCHHGSKAWEKSGKSGTIYLKYGSCEMRDQQICQGWTNEVRELANKGWFKDKWKRMLRRAMASNALVSLDCWMASKGREKKRHFREATRLIKMLMRGRPPLQRFGE